MPEGPNSSDAGRPQRPPMNVYTAMLLLSFVALAVGCLLLAIDLYSRRLPLSP
jgi:hypothetical protein